MSDTAATWTGRSSRSGTAQLARDARCLGRARTCAHAHGADVDADCRALVRSLGAGGWLRHAVGGSEHGGAPTPSTRAPSA